MWKLAERSWLGWSRLLRLKQAIAAHSSSVPRTATYVGISPTKSNPFAWTRLSGTCNMCVTDVTKSK